MKKMPLERLDDLFSAISSTRPLYAPVKKAGKLNFAKWEKGEKTDLKVLHTVRSPKDMFFPQTEDLMLFKMEGKSIDVLPVEEDDQSFAVIGVRACDARSMDLFDMVYLRDPVDTYYRARRENGIIITVACSEPEETCFCETFDIDPTEPGGDIAAYIADGYFYWEPRTDNGKAFVGEFDALFEDAEASELDAQKAATKEIMQKLPLKDLDLENFGKDPDNELFYSSDWEDLSSACVGCGTCTFVCPTCQCYDIRDFKANDDIQRFRCWDSCMYSDFTMMAHGTPRLTQLERFRQRFMHKLVYFPENNDGTFMCVGCGRCVSKCPISMNIVKVIKRMGAEQNDD